ncbi:putative aldouronate transport system permease protein [Aristaeella lactis]|uniref:Aldouronate transport system permease protein n=1 Tax=Aristaeella lactis TaxID=3046383 RepID=A0AC61PJ51_9FIRM|nr:putative aldouronate transport system permease protein [Aristaeella lactis]
MLKKRENRKSSIVEGKENMKTQRRKSKLKIQLKRDWRLYAMLAIPFIWYIIFCYKPMGGVIIAFQKYSIFKGITGSKFVGLDNFKFVFGMRDFGIALGNTLLLNFMDLVFGFPMPIILAIMLNEMRAKRLKKFSQTMLYLPHFLSWVIIGGMVLKIFAPTTGVINASLLKSGLVDKNVPFLTQGNWWQFTYVLVGVWQNMGWGTILYLAAITGLDMNLFEAAQIDGANKLQQIWHVTLPGIRSTIIILLILNIGRMMSIGFDRPYIIGNTIVKDYCDVISTFVYRVGIVNTKFDRATAVGLFQSVIGMILVTVANTISRAFDEQGIW